jgi:hypothetical protein
MRWDQFETVAPQLARDARSQIDRFGFVYVGTVRRDGTPRISVVEAHVAGGHLMLTMIAASQKARDVIRDPRVTLQSPVMDAADPGVEVKLRGQLVDVDERQRAVTTDAIERASGWRPQPSWRFFSVELAAVALLAWEHGALTLTRWDAARGAREPARLRLDATASAYRPAAQG